MAFVTELLGYIGLDVDEQSFDRAQFNITGMIKSLGGIIAAAGAVDASIKGLTLGLVNSFAETAVEIDQISKRLNIGAEGFQSMAYAASQYGIEQDAIVDGMKELSMRSAEFAQDGKANADAFGAIGITQAQVKQYGNNIEGLFELVRQKLSEVKEQGQRQFLSDALFGGGLADVGGEFFTQTSEQIKELQKQALDSGVIITDESIALAKQYTDDIGDLTSRIKGLWQIIASNLLPVFSEAAKRVKEFLDLHGEDIIAGLTMAFRALSDAVKYLGIAAAIAMPYLVGSAAIASWAKLIALTNALTTAFATMRSGALLAWAAAAAGPVLVGLAIGALILAIQDVYTYFTGGDSITGRIVAEFTKSLGSVKKLFAAFGNWFHEWFSGFIASSTDWMGNFDKKVAQMGQPIVDKIKLAWTGLKEWFIDWAKSVGNELASFIPDWLKDPMSLLPDWARPDDSGSDDQQPAQREQGKENREAKYHHARGEERRNVESPPGIHQLIIPGNAPGAAPVPTVMSPPTMAQGMAQANAGRGNVITTNSGNTTVGEIIVNGAENPVATAQAIREELRRDNASRTKGTDTGVRY